MEYFNEVGAGRQLDPRRLRAAENVHGRVMFLARRGAIGLRALLTISVCLLERIFGPDRGETHAATWRQKVPG
jgi:hypothetical protein